MTINGLRDPSLGLKPLISHIKMAQALLYSNAFLNKERPFMKLLSKLVLFATALQMNTAFAISSKDIMVAVEYCMKPLIAEQVAKLTPITDLRISSGLETSSCWIHSCVNVTFHLVDQFNNPFTAKALIEYSVSEDYNPRTGELNRATLSCRFYGKGSGFGNKHVYPTTNLTVKNKAGQIVNRLDSENTDLIRDIRTVTLFSK